MEFISAPGTSPAHVYRPGGPYALVTGRCVFAFERERGRFRLHSVHPGHTVDEVLANTGFAFDVPDAVPETPLPSPETFALIRGPVGAMIAETYPRFAAEVLAIRGAPGRPPQRSEAFLTPPAEAHAQPDLEPLWDTEARAIVDHAIDRYIAARHERVAGFVDRHFSLIGSCACTVGPWPRSGARASQRPVDAALSRHAGGRCGSARLGARQAARRLTGRKLFLDTDVGRELTWLLHTELLELPYDDGGRRSKRDALAETILADARVAAAVDVLATLRGGTPPTQIDGRGFDNARRCRHARAAAADLVNNVLLASAGMAAFQKLTPGTLTLGPAIAAALAQQAAAASFPLGASLGGIWYGLFLRRHRPLWSRAPPAGSCCSPPARRRSPAW